MISKELLSEVLGIEGMLEIIISGKEVDFHYGDINTSTIMDTINIYELAHKCKEWALKQGYEIVELSHNIEVYKHSFEVYSTNNIKHKIPYDLKRFFKACEWILENR